MRWFTFPLLLLISQSSGNGAENPRFSFNLGEALQYRIAQKTEVTETTIDEKTSKPETRKVTTTLDLVRQWKVASIDKQGNATLEMSIVSMRWEQKNGDQEADIFDSAKPDDLNKNVMAKNVGPVLASVTVDANGNVTGVKDSKVGPAHRFSVDIPFKIAFPSTDIKDTWTRDYTIQLDPPQGTGEKYPAKQTYTVGEPKNGFLIYSLTTEITELPKGVAEQIPLLPLMQTGTIFFHRESGRYFGSRLKIDKELKNHQAEGSSYHFTSTFSEDFVQPKN